MQTEPFRADLARSIRLFRAFRKEQTDPDYFYGLLARDTVAQLGTYTDLNGALVADVGGGPGYFTEVLRAAGARAICIDCDAGEMSARTGVIPDGSVLGSALDLPLRTGSVDVCFSSNVLEHVPDPWRMAEEMVRVTKPGGIIYLSFTNWLSPWGGHETSPWHYLGGRFAARRYERRYGRPPKNLYGTTLFPVSVSKALAWARRRPDVELIDARPRYHPRWATAVVHLPGVREFVTWNLLLVLRRR
ncbi:SAM-dependent methyltransferase [Thermobispora bispora]|uniref:Methyltransferase type 11 n=1 Tax=Thermobispora bispora (strain ATCC 19993 / DSM 43833 / CBS 139.67 / JCM 10125 / KCTC 9307 / NBRC 14880 / R51) TaxID=469371 RepID=D6Y6F9_THEBD|nr:class I SAM-dependent methyltransferase [Thermobispora bispora]MBO2472870.1 class I SAM-dependent methyltransferase [Actinomycetales bacterium]MDI9580456.1 class I SAM-dependent methyltransferase [Thermobispora sp.]ADG87531.1 Methyltransferase type 11 [Thermobispora bispora DSM 43833]MBX6166661.1 class I SAM-dependent methyltransferase [Thermobispora bispora]QSI47462.1 class I SAM-dependent methyltransferase [Thermobispora bispora]